MPLGSMMSCVFAGIFRHKYGTKLTMQLFSVPAVLGSACITLPWNIYMLLLGRFLIGITIGCYMFLVQIYVGEISTKQIRASLLNFIHIFVFLGVLFSYVLGQLVSLRTLNIICGAIPLFYLIGFQAMPETVPYLLSKRKVKDAEMSMNFMYKKVAHQAEFKELLTKPDKKNQQKQSMADLLKIKSTRRATIIMVMQFFFFQMCGTNAVNFYSKTIFIDSGIDIDPGNASIINVSILVISSFISVFYARQFGRRVMLITFNILSVISLCGLGLYFTMKNSGWTVETIGWMPLICLCMNSVAFCLGMAPVTYGLLGELFTIEAKKVIAPFAQTLNHGLTFLIGLSFPFFSSIIGTGNVFLIFAATIFIDIIFAYNFIPETQGKSFEEIQKALDA
ncbi:hypothetical protein ACKWTF_012880 [Chironomus riparius]